MNILDQLNSTIPAHELEFAGGVNTDSRVDQKRRNRAKILTLVRRWGSATRLELLRATGLSNFAVPELVEELRDQGVLEGEREGVGRGRPRLRYRIRAACAHAVGVHLAIGYLFVVVIDAHGNMVARQSAPLRKGTNPTVLSQTLAELMTHVGLDLLENSPLGVGLATAGLLDVNRAVARPRFVQPPLSGARLDLWAQEVTGLPVKVDWRLRAGARAEARVGAGRDLRSFLHVRVTETVGAAVSWEGVPLESRDGFTGEIAHLHTEKGPLHEVVSLPALRARLGLDEEALFARLKEGDRTACDATLDTVRVLARAVAPMLDLLGIPALVLRHPLLHHRPDWLPIFVQGVRERLLPQHAERLVVRLATLHEQAPPIGAALLWIDRYFAEGADRAHIGAQPVRRKA